MISIIGCENIPRFGLARWQCLNSLRTFRPVVVTQVNVSVCLWIDVRELIWGHTNDISVLFMEAEKLFASVSSKPEALYRDRGGCI